MSTFRSVIPYGKQTINDNDIKAVVSILKSDYLTQGPMVPKFEEKISKITDSIYAVASNSATSSLHLACLALGLKTNDILWTSPISFVASANIGYYCGAKVDFVDIDTKTFNICPLKLEEKLIWAAQNKELPKILVVVHFAGEPSDMKPIHGLAQKYGFRVIEDASHAIGAQYKGSAIGACLYSDITVFSFHPVKICTTGEGGVATTNDKNLYNKMKLLRSHGITRDHEELSRGFDEPWYYEQIDLGMNFRMTDMQAPLRLSQLEQLSKFIELRHNIAENYDKAFKNTKVKPPIRDESNISALHLYVVRVPSHLRKKIFNAMRKKNILVNVHYIPIHLQPFYKEKGFKEGDFKNSENYYKECLTLPLFPTLSSKDQNLVINSLKEQL